MKTPPIPILVLVFTVSAIELFAQCNPTTISGSNLVTNGGFESGDTAFSTSLGCSWNDPSTCSCHGSYSSHGQYFIGYSPSSAGPCTGDIFQSTWNQTPHSGNNFMMVDGDGDLHPTVWSENVTVQANTYYYFQVYITTLGNSPDPSALADLQFDINGDTLGHMNAPTTSGQWLVFYQPWYSNTVSGPITIQIKDFQTNVAGANQDDFGLDDIVFQKGCPPDQTGSPSLGPDKTLCGIAGTSVTLDPGTPPAGRSVLWSTGSTSSTLTVSTGGEYYACFIQPGQCPMIDSINVQSNYTVDLGSDVSLCNPASTTLDPGFGGSNVTYKWYKDDTLLTYATNSRTLTVNSTGNYRVDVTDVNCTGVHSDSVSVSIQAGGLSPNNVDYCLSNSATDTSIVFSVTKNGANVYWYDAATGGTPLSGGNYTKLSDTSMQEQHVVTGDTLYAQNFSQSSSGTTGPTTTHSPFITSEDRRAFNVLADSITIQSVKVYTPSWASGGTCNKPTPNFTIYLYQSSIKKDSVAATANCDTWTTVPLNLKIPQGNGYELRLSAPGDFFASNNSADTAAFSIANVISIPQTSNDYSGPFFDWSINYPSTCARTPVMAFDGCTLPLTLLSFNALSKENQTLVSWSVSKIPEEGYFSLQRLSEQGYFETIGILRSEDHQETNLYQYSDYAIHTGVMYYRLVFTDSKGNIAYSKVISVQNTLFYVSLFPNPFSGDKTNLLLSGSAESRFTVSVYDLTGRELERFTNLEPQTRKLGALLSKGVYLIRVSHDTETKTIRMVKQ